MDFGGIWTINTYLYLNEAGFIYISVDILVVKIYKNSYMQQENALRYLNYSILR